ncbi:MULTISPECIES: hypothetical protein [Bacillus amyloliquefaciens group]|uniref:hypothetical protein n=1 Tax=Bacillus amyloliquefaciens group TaxID=1938374 RepID=UPI00073C22D7|nr:MULTISPECIES: hypothetical protein [Bacillus amyloliquefaciens group]KTF59821.1 hypothetical protein AR691_13895 [Bacillus amyloliquefaciens]
MILEEVNSKIYRGLERNLFEITPEGEKKFWHEGRDEYTPDWVVRVLEDSTINHYTSDFWSPINLGKFKHVLLTRNKDFEFRVFEFGVLRITKNR